MNERRGLALLVLWIGVVACSSSDPAKVMADARHKLAAGQRAQAVFELRELIRKRPAAGEARVMLSGLLLDQGDLSGARLTLAGLDAGAADTPEAVLVRVDLAVSERRFADALAELNAHGARLDPQASAVRAARALIGLGRAKEAVDRLQASLAAAPDSVPLATELAVARASLGDPAAALRGLEDLVQRHRDPDALATLGSIELRLERVNPAAHHLEDALAAAPADWPPTRRWSTELTLGDAYLAQRDLSKSQSLLAVIRKELPNSAGVRLLAARVAMLDRRPHDAVAELTPLVQSNQMPLRTTLLYVNALEAAGEHEQALLAIGAMRNQVAAAPNGEALLTLGSAQAAVKDFPAAIASLDEAYRLSPSLRTAEAAYLLRLQAGLAEPEQTLVDWVGRSPDESNARFLLGEQYRRTGRTAEAVSEFEAAIAHDPGNFAARNNLASMLTESDPPRAESLAREALALAPRVPAVQDTLGWILVQRSKATEGLPLLAAAARSQRGDEAIQFHYATALVQSGRGAEAKMILETMLLSTRDAKLRAGAAQLLDGLRKSTQKRDG